MTTNRSISELKSARLLAGLWLATLGVAAAESKEPAWVAMLALVRERFPKVPQLSTAELAAWRTDPARAQPLLLDAREPAEFAVSHLPGAIRVAPEATAKAILARIEPGRPVVVYCSVGYRSSRLAARLMEGGRPGVYNLEGSIFAWANEGRPLVSGDEQSGATRVHPFDATYGKLLKPELRAP